MNKYLEETKMLNFSNHQIQLLIKSKKWQTLDEFNKIKAIYEFVQNEILLGFNAYDTLTAVQVLNEGIGQCNTKATLLMALLRSVDIPCRLHAFDVTKDFQQGVTSKLIHKLAPDMILHTWVEVYYKDEWIALEGVILDKQYLAAIQMKFSQHQGLFKKYAIAVHDLKHVCIDWVGTNTYIQKEAIIYDHGIFSSPDDLFIDHSQALSKFKSLMYALIGSKIMTHNVNKIRNKLKEKQ